MLSPLFHLNGCPPIHHADGCWFYRAFGSGVWLNVGKTKAYRDRREMRAQHLFNGNTSRRVPSWANTSSSPVPSWATAVNFSGKVRWWEMERVVNRDAYLAGLDSYQILNPQDPEHSKLVYMCSEIVVVRDACLSGRRMLGAATRSACVPEDVPLRSGFKANCACHCSHSHQTINCRPHAGSCSGSGN